MRRIFVEYTCVRDKYTGIGKTVSVLCSAMEEVGYEVVRLTKSDCVPGFNDFIITIFSFRGIVKNI